MKYLATSIENVITIKKNIMFTYQELSSRYEDTGEKHDFWEMVYITEGHLIEKSDDKEHHLFANDIIFHAPNEFHSSVNGEKDKPFKGYFVSFICNSKAMDFFRGYKASLSPENRDIMKKLLEEGQRCFFPHANQEIFTMRLNHAAPIGSQQVYKMYFELLLINILREQGNVNPNILFASKNDIYNDIIKRICAYLADNIYSDTSLNDICQKFNYSRTFLGAKFKEREGVSIMHYYTGLKIDEACNLMENTDYSLSHIASLLNFSNPYYFSRMFKQYKNISPSEYKKRHKNTSV